MARARVWGAGVVAALLLCLGVTAMSGAPASASPVHIKYAALRFNDSKQEAIMIVPSPVCPSGYRCTWLLLINEPLISNRTIVAVQCCNVPPPNRVWVKYPANFYGVIQADAMISKVAIGTQGVGDWEYVAGARRFVDTRTTTPTTTTPPTTTVPSSTTTTTKPGTTPPTTAPPKGATTGSTSSGHNDAAALPFVSTGGSGGSSGSTSGQSTGTSGTVHSLVVRSPRTVLPYTRHPHHRRHSTSVASTAVATGGFWTPASIALILGFLALLLLAWWLLFAARRRNDEDEADPISS